MDYLVLGVELRAGQYEGRDYSNIMLYCEKVGDNCYGTCVEVIKVKSSLVVGVLVATIQELVGAKVRVNYNRFGQVQSVQFA